MGVAVAERPLPGALVVPPLQSGDRLTRAEFERRYQAMPHLKKAELIKGVVYVGSPVASQYHGDPHFDFITWLGHYRAPTPGVKGDDNSTVRLDDESEPQPDGLLRILQSHGGRTFIENGYLVGGPELAGEVSASSASYDLHDKLDVYREHGVQEYVVWRVYEAAIDWFVLRRGQYERLPLTSDGLYQSEVFPGLWLDRAAMIRGDMARVIQVVQEGVASPEHAAFVARLQAAAAKTQS